MTQRNVNLAEHYISEVYRTRICHWCRRRLNDGETVYRDFHHQVFLCEHCKDFLVDPPDFDPNGTKEKGTTSWRTANILTLKRDDCHCRICKKSYEKDNPVQVHHIIPKKHGGSHHLKNLITLCEKHHRETFKNDHAGLKILDREIQLGKQRCLA